VVRVNIFFVILLSLEMLYVLAHANVQVIDKDPLDKNRINKEYKKNIEMI
jgi:hypothetical protein